MASAPGGKAPLSGVEESGGVKRCGQGPGAGTLACCFDLKRRWVPSKTEWGHMSTGKQTTSPDHPNAARGWATAQSTEKRRNRGMRGQDLTRGGNAGKWPVNRAERGSCQGFVGIPKGGLGRRTGGQQHADGTGGKQQHTVVAAVVGAGTRGGNEKMGASVPRGGTSVGGGPEGPGFVRK